MSQSDRRSQPAPGPFGDDEEETRRMLRQAGSRRSVPADDLAAIRAAARQEWLAMTARVRRRRRRSLLVGLAAVLVVAVGLWQLRRSTPPTHLATEMATVELLRGSASVETGGGGDRRALFVGETLKVGATIETGAAGPPLPGVALRLREHSLRLAAASRARLRQPGVVELLAGTLYVDAPPGARGGLEIVTPLASVRHIGTQFEVHLGDGGALRLRVREGEVEVRADGRRETARRGEELRLDGSGTFHHGTVPTHGPLWSWVEDTAPAVSIEGVPLATVLRWVGRETGRHLEWTDPTLERRTAEIVLHGNIDGLTPLEALEVVLAGSHLTHRLEGDGIVIATDGG